MKQGPQAGKKHHRSRAFTAKPIIKKKPRKKSLEENLYSLEEIVEDYDS
jgi:hypothetical protein